MPPGELANGATLFHEHMSMNNQFWLDMGLERLIDPSRPYFMEDMDYMVAEMQAAAEDGIACIVDGGHADMGRDIEFLRMLSEQSGMPIVASGGYYHEPTFTPDLYERSEEDLVEEMVRDAGVERWGAFGEIGFSNPSLPAERKVLRGRGPRASAHESAHLHAHRERRGGDRAARPARSRGRRSAARGDRPSRLSGT